MAEELRESIEAVDALGNEHADLDAREVEGAKAIASSLGLDREEVEAVVEELVRRELPVGKGLRALAQMYLESGIYYGIRFQQRREGSTDG